MFQALGALFANCGTVPLGRLTKQIACSWYLAFLTTLIALTGPYCDATEEGPPDRDEAEAQNNSLASLNINDLLDVKVVTATKSPQVASEAPAIVTVVTQEEIKTWGYKSVAEALNNVPGLYAIDDFLTPNFGVRGVNGGERSFNRIMKVMINGQSTSFRSNSTNAIGPELIPIEAVDRIEVVRGPSSALYGANAFLAVINIITKKGTADQKGELLARGGASVAADLAKTTSDYGGEILLTPTGEKWSFTAAASYLYANRSGYSIPSESPAVKTGALYSGETLPGTVSSNDIARPLAVFGNFNYDVSKTFTLSTQLDYSHLSSYGEFLDFGTMTHRNFVVRDNLISQAKAEWMASTSWTVTGTLGFSTGGPTSSETLNTGDPTSYPRVDLGYSAWEASLEAKYNFREKDTLILGVDFLTDNEKLETVYTVNALTGSETAPSGVQGYKDFVNGGVYAQLTTYPFENLKSFGLTGNLRYDHQNIYGTNLNWRAGAVDQITDRLVAKLIAGSSYQAPSAADLYAQPLYVGDVVGNPGLQPQTANTIEAQMTYHPVDILVLSGDMYWTHVGNAVEILPVGSNIVPENAGTLNTLGLESEGRVALGAHSLVLDIQWQRTTEDTNDPFRGVLEAPSSSYPDLIAWLSWQYKTPRLGTVSAIEKYYSDLRASESNIEDNYLTPYYLQHYFLTNLAWDYEWKHWRFNAQLLNVLNSKYIQPGYGGVDFPGRRRELFLSLAYRF
jgi:outer membrane receptor for ferrienterochelin and colicins